MTAPALVGPSPQGGGPVPSPDWDDVLADIGDRIRAERQARGWTQTQLARQSGFVLATAKRLENGSVWMRALLQACWAMDVQVDYLLSEQWQMPSGQPSGPGGEFGRRPSLSPKQARVLREAASGDSLAQVGARLGMDSRAVGACLSRVYQRLGVAYLPQGDRRAAAARVAMHSGLFNPPAKRTS